MKLTKVRITKFQSIQDSTEFEVGDVNCLVGKNESGKTALLKALYRLNPIIEGEGTFDVTTDYPRNDVSDYEDDVEARRRRPAQVVQATYALEDDEIEEMRRQFGPERLENEYGSVIVRKGYSNDITFTGLSNSQDSINKYLRNHMPKFLYFDEYYQMKGQDNLNKLKQRVDSNKLEESDHPLLGLIDLAGLSLNRLLDPRRTEALIARLEAAENRLTRKVLKYWSQNRHLRMQFDIRPGQSGDDPGMTNGMNILGRVKDTKHMVSTPLGTRSKGFVWFFSFLAWYSKLQKEDENLILLLDEPGLSLHAKAQADLLRYFEGELKPHHQLIYTTHSPFMVDPRHFDRVRIVQDLSIESDSDEIPKKQQGTKVITDVLRGTEDSLFPLQSALGYEIHQTLFVGPNCLIVEGVSDLLYIQTVSAFLQEKGKSGLDARWTITPVGGSSKVSTFVALIGSHPNLNTAVLIDYQQSDQQNIENLYKRKLLRQRSVFTYADYVEGGAADIEDMFTPEIYLGLVNKTFESSINISDLPDGCSRIIPRLAKHLNNNPLPHNATFNHYRPARYLAENIGSLSDRLDDSTCDRFQRAFDALNKLL